MSKVLVYNEDCKDTLNRLDDNSIDLVITSPPYLNAREYSQYSSIQDYMSQMEDIFKLIFDKLKLSKMCVVNISPVLVPRESRNKQSYRIPLPFYYVPMMENLGFEFLEDIIWVKPDGAVPNRNANFYKNRKPLSYKPNIVTEYILVFKKSAPFLIEEIFKDGSLVSDGYERTNVWNINPKTNSWHPAPFPDELADKLIRYYSYEEDLVYDPFSGSGTVGVVSQRLNRNALLSELNSDYYNKMLQNNNFNRNLF
jgi:DNA modification methylase